MVAVLLLALTAGPVLGGNHDSNVENAKKAQKGLNGKVLGKKDVVGTAVGKKDGAVVLRVFTAKKGVAGIPKKQDDFDVVITVTGPISALGPQTGTALVPSATHTTSRIRPAPIGVSTGHPNITAGTIGARVTDGNNVYALSNNHVFANENNASIGDNVLQPDAYDGGVNPSDAIGTLSDFKRIKFNNFGKCINKGKDCNTMDAAIALSSTANLGNATLPEGYGTPTSTTVSASNNLVVKKYGRTTSQTVGTITGISATVNVGYGSGSALFVDQIIVESGTAFIQGGDSGSLLVTDAGNHPVGLLFAGNAACTFAIANSIDLVLNEFGVTVDAGSGDPPSDTPTPEPTATPEPDPTPISTPEPDPTSTPPPGSGNMGVYDISWRSKKKNLDFTVNIRWDSDGSTGLTDADSLVEAAHVNATLTHDTDGDQVFECGGDDTCWTNFGGDTNSNGSIKFALVGGAPSGQYQAEVTGLTHATYTWDTSLDVDNLATLTR